MGAKRSTAKVGGYLGPDWRGDTPDESSVSARLGKAISSMPPSDLCPWHDASIVFSAAAVLPGTLNGDIDDRYTLSSCRRYIYLQYIHGQDRVATNLDRTEKKKSREI